MAAHHRAVERLNRENPRPSTFYDGDPPDPSTNPVFQTFEQQLELFVTSVRRKTIKRKGQIASEENVSSKELVSLILHYLGVVNE